MKGVSVSPCRTSVVISKNSVSPSGHSICDRVLLYASYVNDGSQIESLI